MLQRIDTPGEHHLTLEGGECVARDCVVEVTAPNVTLVIDGKNMTRKASDPQGDHDWPVFVRVAKSALNCRMEHSALDNVDGIAVDVLADGFVMTNTLLTRYAGGIRLDGCRQALIRDSAIHSGDKMLRLTVGGNDDVGASGLITYNSPFDPTFTVVRNCYIGNNRARSEDYGWDGSDWEIWQAQSVLLEDCVLLDSNVALETGSKGPQVGNLQMLRCYVGRTGITNELVRGLMFRPVIDSLVESCKFFDLDHWDVVINQGSASYAAGTTRNFVFRKNQHACTRNTKAYGILAGGAPTIDTASETILYGTAAQTLATQLRGEAINRRDLIIAGAGLIMVKPPTPSDDLERRVTALEQALTAETQARIDADNALDSRLDGISTASQ